MANFAEYLQAQHDARREGPIGAVAGLFCTMDHGKIRSVSGVKQWFDQNAADVPMSPEQVAEGLSVAVREYNAQRDGAQTPASPGAQAEWQAWVSGVLEGFDQRLAGIEAALTWLVDAQAGMAAAQQAQIDSRSVQDYRDWAGGDQTRSEAAALGLVTPAPGRSSTPGYEHVLPPTQIDMVGPEHVADSAQEFASTPMETQPGITQPDNSVSPLAQAMGLDADPALAAQRAAIQAEAERIAAGVPADAPDGAYYDESAQVQQVRASEPQTQEWAAPATQSYSPEQWRAWAMTSDIPDEAGE
jgi:hypothetical protein